MTEREKQNLIIPTNQNLKTGGYGIRPYETTEILLTPPSFRPKKNGPKKKKRPPQTVFAFGKYWARPLRNGLSMFALTPLGNKKPFPKRFLRSFFLKKATLGAAAPPRARRRPPSNQNKKG